jgi:SmpA / OmlA family
VTSPSGHVAQPLIGGWGWRALIAVAIATSGFLVALVATVALLVFAVPVGLGVAAGLSWTVCGVLTAGAVETGRWRDGVVGTVQRLAVAFELLATVAVFVAASARGVALLLELPAYGTAPSDAAPWFGAAAVGALAVTLLLAATPLAGGQAVLSRPRLQRIVAGGAIVGGFAAAGAIAMGAAPAGCGMFDFQTERWRSEMAGAGGARLVRMARAVQRCGIVEPGMTRSQVRALLGRPSWTYSGTYTWRLGNSGLLSVQSSLVVAFERREGTPRVTGVRLLSDD